MKNLFSKTINRGLAVLIAVILAVSGIPVVALAENENPPDDYTYGTSGVTQISGDDDAAPDDEEQDAVPAEPDADAPVATSGNTDGDLLLDGGDDEACVCTAFQSDADCTVCKDDATQCFFYYCICETLCGEDSINKDCPICNDDYTSCVQAVEVPELAPLAAGNNYADLQTAMNTATTEPTEPIALTADIDGTTQLTVGGDKTLDLAGNSLTITVTSGNGIKIASDAKLTIMDSGTGGTLTVTNTTTNIVAGSGDGAGINSAEGTLIILGGTIIAQGSGLTDPCIGGAGIGGGDGERCGTIEIQGGTVEAIGGRNAAGIGSGAYGEYGESKITITGDAKVKATGGYWGAGIGSSPSSIGVMIEISGGDVYAKGGYVAAGIGGGQAGDYDGSGINITISGGIVEAISGIGDGDHMAIGKGIDGSDATITFNGDYDYWTNTTTSEPAEKTGSGAFTNNDTYKYVKLVEKSAETAIESAAITVTAPVTGATPDTTASGGSNFTIGAVTWSPSGSPFKGGAQYTATVTLTAADGYTFTGLTTATINSQTATVTNNDGGTVTLSYQFAATTKTAQGAFTITNPGTKTYGNDNFNLVLSASGSGSGAVTYALTSGNAVTVTAGGTVSIVGAGSVTITATKAADDYYNSATATVTFTVTKAQLTPSINFSGVSNRAYNGLTSVTGAAITLAGAKTGDNPTATATFAFADANVGTNKAVSATSITLDGTWGDKYTLSVTSLNGIASGKAITAAPLTITGFSISKVYDGTNTVTGGFGTLAFGGLQNSETATVDTAGVAATYDNATVGASKAITFSGSFGMTGGTANSDNYTITQPTSVMGAITAATLGGTVTINGTVQPGQKLTVDVSGITPAAAQSETLKYDWQVGSTMVETNASGEYTVKTADAGEIITVSVSVFDNSNYDPLSTLSASTSAVPYTIKLVKSGDTGTDDVYFGTSGTMETYAAGSNVSIRYALAGTGTKSNGITYSGASSIAAVTAAGSGTSSYTVNSGDATGGVITITAVFSHTDYADVSITETPQTYTYDGNAKSFAITGTPDTGFSVTYNGSGTVPTNAGTYDIAITRGADSDYNAYSKTITGGLVIEPATPTGKPSITIGGDGTPKIGATLTASTSDMVPTIEYTYQYQWNVGGTAVSGATNKTYTVLAADVGKTVTVTVTASGNYSGTATSDATAAVPYTINLVKADGDGTDDVYFASSGTMTTHAASGTVVIGYVLNDTHIEDKLVLSAKGSTITEITNPATTSYSYTVNAAHAVDGVITITGTFSHTSVLTTVDVSVTAPVKAAAPTNTLSSTPSPYDSSSVSWSPMITGGKFLGGETYTATVTLNVAANSGITFDSGFTAKVNGSNANAGSLTIVEPTAVAAGYVTFSYTFTATAARAVSSIAVTTDPTKTTYSSGDTLDLSGIVVTATYDDGTTGTVTPDGYKIDSTSVTGGTTVMKNAAHDGKPITVSYGDKTANTTANLTVNKLTVQLGAVTGADSTDAVSVSGTYDVGDIVTINYTLANTELVNTLTFNNGISAITTPATNAATTYTVNKAHATGGVITITATFSHTSVLTGANISVTAPTKAATPQDATTSDTNYTITDTVWNGNLTGGKFAGGETYTATITLEATGNATFDSSFMPTVTPSGGTVGNISITDGGKKATFTVTYPALPAKAVSGITVTTQPLLTYVTGDKLDLSALLVKVDYDDTSTENIAYNKTGLTFAINSTAVANGDTSMSNTRHDSKKIAVSYNGKSADTNVLTVYEPLSAQIAVSEIDSTSATLTYSATTDSRNTVTSKLQVKSGGTWVDVAGAGASEHTASGLSPNTSYEYRIWAKDTTTNREYIEPVRFITPESGSTGITVDGDIIDNTNPTAIWVTLEHGNTVISSVQATAKGGVANTYTFSFSNVPDGIFNLVVDNGSWKVTQAVTIVSGVVTHPIGRITIDMSTGRTQSIVDIVTDDTPPTAVGGLPELFKDTTIYTAADEAVVAANGTVEIKLAVEKKDEADVANDASAIKSASGQDVGLYLDLSVIKSQFDDTGAFIDDEKLTDLNGKLITITFELPDDLKGKNNLTIYRVHGSNAEALTSTPNADGETAVISGDIVTLNVCKFSTYAIAYTPSNPNPAPPPGGGSSSSGGGGGGGTSPAIISTYWIEKAEAKTMAKSAKEQGAEIARSRRATITGIRKASLLLLSESGLRYQHDTVQGNAVQVRVYVDDPSAATKDILVSGYVTGDAVDKTKAIFGKWYPNKIAVVSFDAQGNFGMKIEVAAKVDLSGMDTSNLYFYSYDKATNKYKRILTEYRIDASGYLHFATELAGSIIITDAPLSGKSEPQNPGTGGDGEDWNIDDLHNPNTGGDGIGMFVPPTQAQTTPQTAVTSDAMSEAATVDNGILKLESREKSITNSGAGIAITDAVIFDLDAPIEAAKGEESRVWLLGGIGAIMLLMAITISWAVIPRKSDVLVQDNERRL